MQASKEVEMTEAGVTAASATTHQQKRCSSRYSIMSDPRLSQLFALSSQLEALAESCCQDNEPEAVTASADCGSPPPPPIPPKTSVGIMTSSCNGNSHQGDGDGNLNCPSTEALPPERPPKPPTTLGIRYVDHWIPVTKQKTVTPTAKGV